LKGLRACDVSELAKPVFGGNADVSLSLRKNSLALFRMIGMDFITGERVVRKSLLAGVLNEVGELPSYGIEMFMNQRIVAQKLRIAVVRWNHVSQTRKTEKVGWLRGVAGEWRMLVDLARTNRPWSVAVQTVQMRRLRYARPREASGHPE
jgi:hypothetical protein